MALLPLHTVERMEQMNKRLTFTGANILFLIFTLVFLAYQFILGIIMGESINDHIYLIVLINELLIVSSVLIYCFIKKINIKEAFRFNKLGLLPALLIIAIALPAAFTAGMFNSIMIYLLQFIGDLPAQGIPVPGNLTELLVGILIIAVAPGVCEEIMHRGFLLRAYEKRGTYKAVVIVSIYFGLFHFDITNLFGPIILGLIIGYYVVRTNSIYAGILAHFLNNAIAEVMQYILQEPKTKYLTVSGEELVTSIVWGIIGAVVTGVFLIAFKKVTEGKSEIIPSLSRVGQDVKAVISHWPIIVIIVLYILMAILYIFTIVMMKLLGL